MSDILFGRSRGLNILERRHWAAILFLMRQMHCSLRENFGNKMAAPMVLHPQCHLSSISRPLGRSHWRRKKQAGPQQSKVHGNHLFENFQIEIYLFSVSINLQSKPNYWSESVVRFWMKISRFLFVVSITDERSFQILKIMRRVKLAKKISPHLEVDSVRYETLNGSYYLMGLEFYRRKKITKIGVKCWTPR